jgi:hypothetical protein
MSSVALRKELVQTLLSEVVGLEERASKVAGGSALFYKGKEIAHFHSDNEIDVRLTKKVITSEGLSHPTDSEFHADRAPSSQWFEMRYSKASDLKRVVRLFKLACEQY